VTDLHAILEAVTPAWHDRARCRDHAHLFFPPAGELRDSQKRREAAARTICARCPVQGHCLAWAEAHDEWRSGGIWGGLTPFDKYGHRSSRPRRVSA